MIPYDLPQYRTVAEAAGADGVICKADFKDECTRLLDRLNA